MKNIIIDDYIKTNSEIYIFDNIIEQLKEKINNNVIYHNNIHLYFKTLYNNKNKIYDRLLIHCFYKKNIKNEKEYKFAIILNENYNYNIFPKIYCQSLDIDKNINLVDKRDLFDSITEKKYNNKNDDINSNNIMDLLLDIIIIKIPEFVRKIYFLEENKILMHYGKYYLNEIYNINDFICNKNIYFYKIMTYKCDEDKVYTQLNIKYIIITDFYILFFDLINDKPKNICKLFFIGEIFKINSFERIENDDGINDNIINEENENINISNNKIYIDWISENNENKEIKFIFSIIYDKNNKENNPDLIDIINKKQTFIGINYKLVMKDYNEYNNQNELKELINLSKILEKKEKLYDKSIIYIKEMNKICQKIIDLAEKFDKEEIIIEYLDKIKKLNKEDNTYNKRIYFHSFDKNDKDGKIFNEKKGQKKNSFTSLMNLIEKFK